MLHALAYESLNASLRYFPMWHHSSLIIAFSLLPLSPIPSTLQSGSSSASSSSTPSSRSSSLPSLIAQAVVPDDHSRLAPARSCALIDTHALRLLHRIEPSRLRFVHPLLPARVAAQLGVVRLSDVVTEVGCVLRGIHSSKVRMLWGR